MVGVPKQVAATDGSSASTKAIARRRICSQRVSASGGIAPSAKLPADAVLAPAACMRSHAAIVGSRIWPAGSSCPAAARQSRTSSAQPVQISTSAAHSAGVTSSGTTRTAPPQRIASPAEANSSRWESSSSSRRTVSQRGSRCTLANFATQPSRTAAGRQRNWAVFLRMRVGARSAPPVAMRSSKKKSRMTARSIREGSPAASQSSHIGVPERDPRGLRACSQSRLSTRLAAFRGASSISLLQTSPTTTRRCSRRLASRRSPSPASSAGCSGASNGGGRKWSERVKVLNGNASVRHGTREEPARRRSRVHSDAFRRRVRRRKAMLEEIAVVRRRGRACDDRRPATSSRTARRRCRTCCSTRARGCR